MSANDVIGCAPFRLQGPRPLTPYEWSVVRTALYTGFAAAGAAVRIDTPGAVEALVGALGAQRACPSWNTSAFGPPPAVAPRAYTCLGAWFGGLDPVSRANALRDIGSGAVLCAPNPPWAGCPGLGGRFDRVADSWEGAPQQGLILPGGLVVPGTEPCAEPRSRTGYAPMTLDEMLKMFTALGGQVPPIIQSGLALLPPSARARTFLLGVQLKQPGAGLLGALATSADPLALARAVTEAICVVWAPNTGADVTGMLYGNMDPSKLIAIGQALAPDVLGGILGNAAAAFPDLTGLLGALLGTSQRLHDGIHGFGGFGATGDTVKPGTRPATGAPVVDAPGASLPTDSPIPGVEAQGHATVGMVVVATAALVAVVAAAHWLL